MIHAPYKNSNSEKHKYDSRNCLKPHSLKTATIHILLNALGIIYKFVYVNVILCHVLDPGFPSQQCLDIFLCQKVQHCICDSRYVLPFLLDKRRMGKWNNVETGKRETLISIIIAPNFLIYPLTIDVCFQYFTVTNLLGSFPTNFFIFFSNRREIYLLRCLWEMQAGKEALPFLYFFKLLIDAALS